LPNTQQNTALRPETEAPGEQVDLLGAQLLSLLSPLRLHSVSIFDADSDVQWLSQGALGPDEQSVVEEAVVTLAAATTRAHLEASLSDGRAALFLAVRTPRATLAGLVMVLMDAKILSSGNVAARILTTSMRSVLQKVAMLLVPPPPLGATGIGTGIRSFSIDSRPLEVTLIPGASPGDPANDGADDLLDWQPAAPSDAQALAILEPASAVAAICGADVLSWSAQPEVEVEVEVPDSATPTTGEVPSVPRTAGDTGTATVAAARGLQLRELIRLRPGGRTRRYQIVPVAEQQRGDALATLNQLLAWLQQNPTLLQGDPVSFTIGVSAQALADPQLPAALGRALASASQDPRIIGFELRESACVNQRLLAERFLTQCEQSQCFAVIDDFTFNTAALDLLRSSAVRLLKVETRLVAAALRDKLAQARVVAIAQAAKVLGTHCAAKYVDSQSGRRWLTAVGFDFTQSSVVEPMDRLLEPLSS
jgi:EAL domain-containing protein (putative c-di-GMP-specific phosphodiesterase class I)